MGTRYLFVLLCCFPSTECDSSCATQSPVHASANLPDKRLPGVRGVYYFCPPYSLPRSFLDRARNGRLHLLIRKRLLARLGGGGLLRRKTRSATQRNRKK